MVYYIKLLFSACFVLRCVSWEKNSKNPFLPVFVLRSSSTPRRRIGGMWSDDPSSFRIKKMEENLPQTE